MSHTPLQTAESFNQPHRGSIECPCRECRRKDIEIHALELKVILYKGIAAEFAKKLRKEIDNEPKRPTE